jgi:hypothetical protein
MLAQVAKNNASLTTIHWILEIRYYNHRETSFLKALGNLGNLKQLNIYCYKTVRDNKEVDFSAVALMVMPQLEGLKIEDGSASSVWKMKSFLGAIASHPSL